MLRINELVERITANGGVALLNLHQPANYNGEVRDTYGWRQSRACIGGLGPGVSCI